MKHYKFIGTEKDIGTLNDLGYGENIIDVNRPIQLDNGYFDGAKSFDTDKVCVTVNNYGKDYSSESITVYRYDGNPNNHHLIEYVEEPLKYIQELIDCGLVVETSKKGKK